MGTDAVTNTLPSTEWYKRLSRWAEENPKAVKTISVVLSQFVAAAARMPR